MSRFWIVPSFICSLVISDDAAIAEPPSARHSASTDTTIAGGGRRRSSDLTSPAPTCVAETFALVRLCLLVLLMVACSPPRVDRCRMRPPR
jgi:hypothetical protein